MDEFIKALPGLGVGGALAVLTFYFYRQDRVDSTHRYAELFLRLTAVTDDFKSVIQENSRAIQRNTDVIEHLESRVK